MSDLFLIYEDEDERSISLKTNKNLIETKLITDDSVDKAQVQTLIPIQESPTQDQDQVRSSAFQTMAATSRIIVADDQFLNMEVLINRFREIGVFEKCDLCYNGA